MINPQPYGERQVMEHQMISFGAPTSPAKSCPGRPAGWRNQYHPGVAKGSGNVSRNDCRVAQSDEQRRNRENNAGREVRRLPHQKGLDGSV
jgi:hypothetical protein